MGYFAIFASFEQQDLLALILLRATMLSADRPYFMILFSRADDVDSDDFGLAKRYAFEIQTAVDSVNCMPLNIFTRLMLLFQQGQTHFDDGYEHVISEICGDETAVSRLQMHRYICGQMKPENLWTRNIDFGSNYFVLDFKQI